MREKSRDRVNQADGCVVVSGFVLLIDKFTERKAHGIAEKENRDQGQQRISKHCKSCDLLRKGLNPLCSDQFDHGIDRRHQADDQRNNAGDPSCKGVSTRLEQADESLCQTRYSIHNLLLVYICSADT